MTKSQLKDNYWVTKSNSYMKHFHERCEVKFEEELQRYAEDCKEAEGDEPHLKLWQCFQGSSSLGHEISLQLAQFYLKDDWPNYLSHRTLMAVLYNKIVEWTLATDRHVKNDYALQTLSISMINQVVLPLLLGTNKTECLPTFQFFLEKPVGTCTGFRPDLTETFKQMVGHKLANTPLPIIERFEVGAVYEYLSWRYKYCTKPSNEVDYALALIPEEMIAYHVMRGTDVDTSLLGDPQFVRMQAALNAIRNGEVAPLQPQLLIDALNQVSDLEKKAYQELGEKHIPLNELLAIPQSSKKAEKPGFLAGLFKG